MPKYSESYTIGKLAAVVLFGVIHSNVEKFNNWNWKKSSVEET